MQNDARALYADPGATLDDLREAVASLEETERIARRVLGGAHPLTTGIEEDVGLAKEALARARAARGAQERPGEPRESPNGLPGGPGHTE